MSISSGQFDGTILACGHLLNVQTQRLDSSLRGPRRSRAHCRAVFSGPNKTLFASFGPNSLGRDHRRRSHLALQESGHTPGRLKPIRGHRYDGMSLPPSMAEVWDTAHVPSDVSHDFNANPAGMASVFLSDLSRLFFQADLIGSGLVVRRLSEGVRFLIAGHGKENSQESSRHRDVGLGFFSGGFQDALSVFFLRSIGSAQDDGGFAQGPAKGGRSGLGDFSFAGLSGGEFVVGGESGPEFDRVGVGESAEVADLGDDDAAPDLVDAGRGLKELGDGFEFFGAVGEGDLEPERFSLTFEQENEVEKIFEGLSRFILEQMSETQEPSLGEIAVEFDGSGQIGGMENGPHGVFDAGERSGELMPVAAELSESRGLGIGDPSERALAPRQTLGDIFGVVEIGFSAFASTGGEFGGIGDADQIDGGAEAVDEPFDKADGFDGHPDGPRQIAEKRFDFLDAFGADGEFGDDILLGVDGDECDGGFVKIDADEGAELFEGPELVGRMRVGYSESGFRCLSHDQDLHFKF